MKRATGFAFFASKAILAYCAEAEVVHIVAYDLKSPNDTEQDYERVISGLKSAYANWCHVEKSVWLISTAQDATAVRDCLKDILKSSDVLFVARLEGKWASYNLGSKRSEWLKNRAF